MKVVKLMFREAVEEGVIEFSPIEHLKFKPKKKDKQPLYGESDPQRRTKKFEHILSTIVTDMGDYGPEFAAFILTAGTTGARPGELCALEWKDVDLTRSRLHLVSNRLTTGEIGTRKNGLPHTVVMPEVTREVLRAIPRAISDTFVFHNRSGGPLTQKTAQTYWREVRGACGLPKARIYDARHYAATYLLDTLGLSEYDASIHLGHTDGGKLVRDTYSHRSEERARTRIEQALGTNVVQHPAQHEGLKEVK